MDGNTMKQLEVGQTASATKTFTEQDVIDFARLSGDNNPIHLDKAFAAKTRFKRPICHGVLTASLISKVAGTQLPGPGSIYLSQTMKFRAPAYVGDTVTAEITIKNIRKDKPIMSLGTVVRNQSGEVLLEGEAMVYYEPVEA
jgi:3-hydroxybutyryl-CoA dehydratase